MGNDTRLLKSDLPAGTRVQHVQTLSTGAVIECPAGYTDSSMVVFVAWDEGSDPAVPVNMPRHLLRIPAA